ncbi:hypothetical protein SeLEV6574_g07995 [Synchytrium endobioticum]|nr:hypothetical protein SeLEV6574_g07995 [Synchytrium endobioticum]
MDGVPTTTNPVESPKSSVTRKGKSRSLSFGRTLESVCLFERNAPPSDMINSPTFVVADNPRDSRAAFGKPSWSISNMMLNSNDALQSLSRSIHQPLVFETAVIENDRRLLGSILVKNIAYEKWVVVRYSTNGWKTWDEVAATYSDSLSVSVDRFRFKIDLEQHLGEDEEEAAIAAWREFRLEREHRALKRQVSSPISSPSCSSGSDVDFDSETDSGSAIDELYSRPDRTLHTLSLCARLEANGTTYWDSNNNQNYNLPLKRVSGRSKPTQRESARSAQAVWDVNTSVTVRNSAAEKVVVADKAKKRHHRRAPPTVFALDDETSRDSTKRNEDSTSSSSHPQLPSSPLRIKTVSSPTILSNPVLIPVMNTTSSPDTSCSNTANDPKSPPPGTPPSLWLSASLVPASSSLGRTVAVMRPPPSNSAASIAASFVDAPTRGRTTGEPSSFGDSLYCSSPVLPISASAVAGSPDRTSEPSSPVAAAIEIPFSSLSSFNNTKLSAYGNSRLYPPFSLYSRSPPDAFGSLLLSGLSPVASASHQTYLQNLLYNTSNPGPRLSTSSTTGNDSAALSPHSTATTNVATSNMPPVFGTSPSTLVVG